VTGSIAPTFRALVRPAQPAGVAAAARPSYRESVDQAVWAESLGFGSAWVSEHHFTEDDYASSPLTIAAAIGARTARMRVGTDIIVAGLHEPVRLAEDATSIGLLTGDRFDLGIGLGYHTSEFAAFGQVKQRPSLLEDAIAIIRRAWSGSAERYEGKRLSSPGQAVTPVPGRPPLLLVGAQSEVGVRRAARLADGVITLANDHCAWHMDGIAEYGRDPVQARIYASQWSIVAEDPERVWSQIGKHVCYQLNKYIEWGSFESPGQPTNFPTTQSVLDAGCHWLMDASTAVDDLVSLVTAYPQVRNLHYWAQFPGESVGSGSERIQYFADKVIPRVAEKLGAK